MFFFSKFVHFSFPIFALSLCIVGATDYNVSGGVYCTTTEPMRENASDPYSPIFVPPPMANVKVELWDEDRGRDAIVDPDDLIEGGYTGKKGQFILGGDNTEIGGEEPYLLVTHKCQEYGKETLKEGCMYISRVDLEGHFVGDDKNIISGIEIFLGANEATLNGINLEIKTEVKC